MILDGTARGFILLGLGERNDFADRDGLTLVSQREAAELRKVGEKLDAYRADRAQAAYGDRVALRELYLLLFLGFWIDDIAEHSNGHLHHLCVHVQHTRVPYCENVLVFEQVEDLELAIERIRDLDRVDAVAQHMACACVLLSDPPH